MFEHLYSDEVLEVASLLGPIQLRSSFDVGSHFSYSCLNYVGCKIIHDNLQFIHGRRLAPA